MWVLNDGEPYSVLGVHTIGFVPHAKHVVLDRVVEQRTGGPGRLAKSLVMEDKVGSRNLPPLGTFQLFFYNIECLLASD